ncbi:unnamed protein product [Spodoptera littoralis]|uniref:Ion transport N-terminal domain-containing protein n=1 Tax=Spodoptera littoralis TaxID=7109 RepID=A0A9P0I341_SPOLI|nr:unnamed protein product [Spodoptera littoralis]CAH1640213.1 unnamed protein product [Spodoptera littoralis]
MPKGDADMSLKQGSGTGKVHFGGLDDVSLYGTPVEPAPPATDAKQGFLRNQLQALFQPTDNKLAMKLFGSKKALMKERIRQKAAGHWVIHPCSSFSCCKPSTYDLIDGENTIVTTCYFHAKHDFSATFSTNHYFYYFGKKSPKVKFTVSAVY